MPNSLLPLLFRFKPVTVADEAAMLAIVGAGEGTIAFRTDLGVSFICGTGDPTHLASWTEMAIPDVPIPTLDAIPGAVADVDLHSHKMTHVATAVSGTDALNRDTGDGRYVHQDGTGMPVSVVNASSAGGVPTWVTATPYTVNQLVQVAGVTYICLANHTSGGSFSGVGTNWAVFVGSGPVLVSPGNLGASYTVAMAGLHEALVEGTVNADVAISTSGLSVGCSFTLDLVGSGAHTITLPAVPVGASNALVPIADGQNIVIAGFSPDGSTLRLFVSTQALTRAAADGIYARSPFPGVVATTPDILPQGNLVTALTANTLYTHRVRIDTTGTLHDLSAYIGTQSGNYDCGIYSTDSTRQALWRKGSTPVPSQGWQILGDPALAVAAGDQLEFVIQLDNATATVMMSATGGSNSSQLPSSFPTAPGGALAKLIGRWATTFGLPTTIPEANITQSFAKVAMAAWIA